MFNVETCCAIVPLHQKQLRIQSQSFNTAVNGMQGLNQSSSENANGLVSERCKAGYTQTAPGIFRQF
jgi:hypothetical protein